MSTHRFSRSIALPEYLEEALAPFTWSSVLSENFRRDIILCVMASDRELVVKDFTATLRLIRFLDREWIEQLCTALERFAKEGFQKQ